MKKKAPRVRSHDFKELMILEADKDRCPLRGNYEWHIPLDFQIDIIGYFGIDTEYRMPKSLFGFPIVWTAGGNTIDLVEKA